MTPILVIFEVFMEVLIPLLMARIIDVGIANGDMGYILSIGVVLVIMAMVSLFFGARQEGQVLSRPQDMPRICGMIFSIKYRNFHLRTLTIFQLPVW